MTSLPDRRRSAITWIVIGLAVALAMVATLLTISLLSKLPTGTGPTATSSGGASATSGPSATQGASASASSTPDQHTAPAWVATGSMIEARQGHTATLLRDGKVLVTGGRGQEGTSAELYDPRSGAWTATGNMIQGRTDHTATLLRDGKVLVAGGLPSEGIVLASAELYDPSSGTWTATGNMVTPRDGPTATLLPDGRVLVTGGADNCCEGGELASAELYDPSRGSWTATAGMAEARLFHTATLLLDGRVLVAGSGPYLLASAELYDPGSGSWTATGSMVLAR